MYSYLIFGGGSLIGRNFVQYLVENELATEIRVIDRMLKETGYFSPSCLKALDKVEYIQGNLLLPDFAAKAFHRESGTWDIVVNCALETKLGQPREIYEDRVLKKAINLANESVRQKVKVMIQISSHQVYYSKQGPSKEDEKFKPKSMLAKFHAEADEAQRKVAGLKMVSLRPAIVYGPGDVQNLIPVLVLAKVYQHLKEPMPFVWKKDFKLNTVHTLDVARAIHHTACWYIETQRTGIEYFNLVDGGNTDSEKLELILKEMFGIKVERCNSFLLTFLKFYFRSGLNLFNCERVGFKITGKRVDKGGAQLSFGVPSEFLRSSFGAVIFMDTLLSDISARFGFYRYATFGYIRPIRTERNLDQFLEDANEKHLEPWSELLKQSGVVNSPLIPYMERDNVKQVPCWLDGSRIAKLTGFDLKVPAINEDRLKEILEEFRAMNLWPGEV